MFLSWIGCLVWLYLLFLAIRRKKMGVNTSGRAILKDELFTEDMSEFERAAAVVSSGKYHMSDAAVDVFPSNNI